MTFVPRNESVSGKKGDEFIELLWLNHGRLFGFVRAMIFSANDAQDVYQETLMALWRQWEMFDSDRDFGAWAIGIARNKVLDYYKKSKHNSHRLDDSIVQQLATPQEPKETAKYLEARRDALAACIEVLADRHKELLRRCYDGQEAVPDVAKSLNRTTGSIYSSLRHIRLRLLKCVQFRLSKEFGCD